MTWTSKLASAALLVVAALVGGSFVRLVVALQGSLAAIAVTILLAGLVVAAVAAGQGRQSGSTPYW